MSVNKLPVFNNKNDNNNYHRKNKRIIKKYDASMPIYKTQHNYDLRLIILRHAERVDQSLGQDWYDQVFGGVPSAPLQAYRHPSLPLRLPPRSNTLLYVFDPPITRLGEQQSYYKGQQLAQAGATVDYCYSSPASRSVLTANAILKGMNRTHIPIRLEPYLFEPMNWNSALLLIPDNINPFMSTTDWAQTGYNIDQHYRRLNNYLNLHETEHDYYNRSKDFFDSIQHHHGRILPPAPHGQAIRRRITILIVGHASSTEMFSTIALRQPFDMKSFGEQSAKVPYLHTAVLERDAVTHIWSLRPVMYFV
jgi:broad specificity phosphatase PhoE